VDARQVVDRDRGAIMTDVATAAIIRNGKAIVVNVGSDGPPAWTQRRRRYWFGGPIHTNSLWVQLLNGRHGRDTHSARPAMTVL
jgi:hypothetical protein